MFILLVAANAMLVLATRQLDTAVTVAEPYTQVTARADELTVPAVTPSPTPMTPAPAAATEVLAVYGDGYALGNEQGGLGVAGWPALVAAGSGMTLTLHAAPQAGYVSVGSTGQNYPGLAETGPVPDAAVTLVVGSRNDRSADAATVQANAQEIISDLRAAATSTAIVIVGPIWTDDDAPADILAVRDAVEAAATAAGVTFVDPIAEGWFAEPTGLISFDGISPTDAGHAHLADLITPLVNAALGQQ
ncbi:SGNH/GDSL hydrolase family protein [Modestobacter sp. KNN46-3]|uniref:SGNH/GDSL hydrolase family protein n=1 Tax=Modestobacter sp. KNN46-3 TaxID=2711218 RepID=UPI0013DFA04A|nr:SGNH/GDSL hydrolase family protein [Modestobacter sp. KNN46-3]